MPRYAVGIDLGTSNSALACVDLCGEGAESVAVPVPQALSLSSRGEEATLPSFLYFPLEGEGREPVAGHAARELSATLPDRVAHSAKSWLCHPSVDREGKLLPWQSESVSPADRMSPVAVSAHFLQTLRDTWNAAYPDAPFDQQAVALTVPASFDAAAQQLTLEAAELAGFPEGTVLLEEPQAAFARWLERHQSETEPLFSPEKDHTVLVCDIGGGTTDFSLFVVRAGNPPHVRRVAVSDHILLGGDNIDRWIAHRFRETFEKEGPNLSARQWGWLLSESRRLKESLLGEAGKPPKHIALPASGAGLFAESRVAQVDGPGLRTEILDRFFPMCAVDARPARPRAGLREIGLPYAADAAVTRHLAAFLDDRLPVDAVLFNGGTLLAPALRDRILQQLADFNKGAPPRILDNPEPALAVARGAAFHAARSLSRQLPIEAGAARAVYLEILDRKRRESNLLCVLPQGTQTDHPVRVDEPPLRVLVDTPARFQVYSSVKRPDDRAGELFPLESAEFHPLPSMQTIVRVPPKVPRPANNLVEVAVEARLNNAGLLKVRLVSRDKKWKGRGSWNLVFNLRGSGDTEAGAERLTPKHGAAQKKIDGVFGKKSAGSEAREARRLFKTLEQTLGRARKEWTLEDCRALWPALAVGLTRRDRSPDHEATWLNLAGFALRPGFGVEMDPFRVAELWRLHDLGLSFPREPRGRTQLWILWRRVAGGLDAAQQTQIAQTWLGPLSGVGDHPPELLRLAGALERVAAETRLAWLETLVRAVTRKPPSDPSPWYWAMGRILGRVPFGGGPENVLTPQNVVATFEALREKVDWSHPELRLAFARAARLTGEPTLDMSEAEASRIADHLLAHGARTEEVLPLRKVVPMESVERINLFGESLPAGLTLA